MILFNFLFVCLFVFFVCLQDSMIHLLAYLVGPIPDFSLTIFAS